MCVLVSKRALELNRFQCSSDINNPTKISQKNAKSLEQVETLVDTKLYSYSLLM